MGERGKIDRPEHTASGSQNKGTEKLQRRAAPSPQEVGGKLSPREATPSHPANRPRFLSEDSLRPDRRRALRPRREKARRIWESAPKPLAAWAAEAGEGTKCKRNRIRAFVEDPKTGTALNAGPAPYRAAGSLSRADGESTDTPEQGKPSEAGTRGELPTHSDVCLQRPALPAAGLN